MSAAKFKHPGSGRRRRGANDSPAQPFLYPAKLPKAARMSKGPQRIRGTQDIWGEEADRFDAVMAAFDRVRRLYAFQQVHIPVFEATEVFARSIGETTDVVAKEMYTFEDRGGDSITLRPEFTAG